MAKMTQTTPYRDRPERERAEEARCFREVLQGANQPSVLYEAFGGIGMVAQIIQGLFPRTWIVSAELDEECVRRYSGEVGLARVDLHHGDTQEALRIYFEHAEGYHMQAASLDYNRCTLLDLRNPKSFQHKLLKRVAELGPDWIQYTDSSIGKLHLNFRSYGLKQYGSREEAWLNYGSELNEWFIQNIGYKIVKEARHSAASYYRLERA